MLVVLIWYVVVTLLGLIAWPLIFRLAPGLPDRGYTFSRALGLMLTGYIFWLLGSLGFLQNTVGGIIFCLLIVFGVALWAYFSRPDKDVSLRSWLSDHRRMVLIAELLFVIGFLGWAIFRAYNPDIAGTEKPMELTFLNGVRNSPAFPPRDPWLSGYAISYYYFGYVLIALIAQLAGTASSVAFNLGIALLFALTLVGSYGLVYNLVAARRGLVDGVMQVADRTALSVTSLLGPLFIGIIGNFGGLLELLHSLKIGSPGFWSWIDLEDLDTPATSIMWPPEHWRYWWWWRSSRVIRDRSIAGIPGDVQPIDEFPFFSFLLGDMHPHVLALPFVMLALGLALNVVLQKDRLQRGQLALYTICFGALAFLNTWDLPIYLFILVAAMIIYEIRLRDVFDSADLVRPILTGIGILVAGVIAYLPWYISFSSQAGGILPNALFPTRFHQFFIMFGLFLFVILWFLIDRAIRHGIHMNWSAGLWSGGTLLITVFIMMLVLGLAAVRIDSGVRGFIAANIDPSLTGQPDTAIMQAMPRLLQQIVVFRLGHPLTTILLVVIIILCVAALLPRKDTAVGDETPVKAKINPSNAFVFALILTAALLTLGPEFVYLRDVFGQRINTLFKFYYAAWLLFGIAAAYGVHEILSRPNPLARLTFGTLLTILIVASLIYPAFAIPAKANDFQAADGLPTLDGVYFIQRQNPGDYAGIQWLKQHAESDAVVLEAVGGQYSYYGRVSMSTGIPTVMGWPGHERQWRGDRYSFVAGNREQDAKEIFDTLNMRQAKDLIRQYRITYIFVGSLERDPSFASAAGIDKFQKFLPIAYQDANVVIYRADQPLIQDTTQ